MISYMKVEVGGVDGLRVLQVIFLILVVPTVAMLYMNGEPLMAAIIRGGVYGGMMFIPIAILVIAFLVSKTFLIE